MIRTRKYKLIFNSPTFGELYNLVEDPHELNNCIDNPDYKEIKKELIQQLLYEMKKLKDPLYSWFHRIKDVY